MNVSGMNDDVFKMLLAAIEQQGAKLEQVRAEVAAQNVELAKIQVEFKTRMCSNPSLCTELLPRIVRLEADVRPLQDTIQQVRGAKWTLGAMITAAGFLAGIAGSKLSAFFTR